MPRSLMEILDILKAMGEICPKHRLCDEKKKYPKVGAKVTKQPLAFSVLSSHICSFPFHSVPLLSELTELHFYICQSYYYCILEGFCRRYYVIF